MGPSRARDQKLAQDDVKVLLQEKDDRIAALGARLEAYNARASTAYTRLLKTIDVLDALRSQHALEISAAEQAKMKLVHELERSRMVAKNLEVEKDELKDVVEDLIEKAGCTYLNMQRGNLNVEFAEQVATGSVDGGLMKLGYDNELLAYATSIIARLRTELDFERQNHIKTVEEANLRIEELEAKVAVREAELEHCITSSGDHEHQLGDISTHNSKKQGLSKKLRDPKRLSDEECLRFLESNNARNRSLEIEIRRIAEKLEQARMVDSGSTSSGSRTEPQSSALRNGHKIMSTFSPRARSASVDPNALSRPLEVGKTVLAPEISSPPTVLPIAQLDNQIRAMATQMDALVSERTTLIETAARQRRVTDGINVDAFQDVLRVEAECVHLQAEVDGLRAQLEHARARAHNRERALLCKIAHLQASPSGITASHPTSDLYHIFSPKPLEDDIAAEESMELGSPLLPTVFHPASHVVHAEADLVSFPFSPNRESSPDLTIPSTPSRAARQSPRPQDIEKMQAALGAARTHLEQKDEALSQLRVEMEKHQIEFQAQTLNDGNGDRA